MKTFTQALPPYGHCIRPEQSLRGKKAVRTPILTEAFVKGVTSTAEWVLGVLFSTSSLAKHTGTDELDSCAEAACPQQVH